MTRPAHNACAVKDAAHGTISAQYEYGPLAEVIRMTSAMARLNPFRISTKYQDDETDLLYYGYRYYNASMGRWLSRDPVDEIGSINLFCAARNDLVSYIDILGAFVSQGTIDMLLGMGREEMKAWLRNCDSGTASQIFNQLRRLNPEKAQDFKWTQKFAGLRNIAKRNSGFIQSGLMKKLALGGCIAGCAIAYWNALDQANQDLESNMDTTANVSDADLA